MPSHDTRDRRLGIWGFGVEGKASVAALSRDFESIVIVDKNTAIAPPSADGRIFLVSESSALAAFSDCDLVMVSPSIPRTHPLLDTLRRQGVPLSTASSLWLETNADRTIGVTGTKGKSTTASLIHHMLRQSSVQSALAGNIGIPLIGIAPREGLVVAELSSYQCAWITDSPRISVVTNLYEDHIPWHGSVARYWADKSRITTQGSETLICDAATLQSLRTVGCDVPRDQWLEVQSTGDEIVARDGTLLLSITELPARLRTAHTIANIRTAALAASCIVGSELIAEIVRSSLDGFRTLPHRLETIDTFNGATWIDDTLSTIPESVIAAVSDFKDTQNILILGGQDRGISYQSLNDYLTAQCDSVDVITIPSNGAAAVAAFRKAYPQKVHPARSLKEAVFLAAEIASEGSRIILSPGAPSFDFYRDYHSKSQEFRQSIKALKRSQAEYS